MKDLVELKASADILPANDNTLLHKEDGTWLLSSDGLSLVHLGDHPGNEGEPQNKQNEELERYLTLLCHGQSSPAPEPSSVAPLAGRLGLSR